MNINNSNINISLSNMVSYKIYKHLKVLILEYLVLKVLTLLIFTIWINWDLRLWYRWRRGWSRKKESRNNQNHIRHKWPQSLKQPRVGSSCWAALLSALRRILRRRRNLTWQARWKVTCVCSSRRPPSTIDLCSPPSCRRSCGNHSLTSFRLGCVTILAEPWSTSFQDSSGASTFIIGSETFLFRKVRIHFILLEAFIFFPTQKRLGKISFVQIFFPLLVGM